LEIRQSRVVGVTDVAVAGEALGFAYRPDQWVFRQCSFSTQKGRVCAVLGPNGSGKSTLLALLIGALKPTEGAVTANGRIAFVPQLFETTFDYRVLDMVLMGRARTIGLFSQPSAHDETLALAALDRIGLAEVAQRPFHELSGGQRQLVIIARALVAQADILVLDEPTSALDFHNQGLVLRWVTRLAHDDGLTIVLTTHHPNHALAVADDILLLFEGDHLFGVAGQMLTEANLGRLYGTEMKRIHFGHDGIQSSSFVPIYNVARRTISGPHQGT
jgi:iron complex transport system ATP-binding protein